MDQLKQLKVQHDEVHIRCSELEVERDSLKQGLLQEQSLRAKMQKDIEQVGTGKGDNPHGMHVGPSSIHSTSWMLCLYCKEIDGYLFFSQRDSEVSEFQQKLVARDVSNLRHIITDIHVHTRILYVFLDGTRIWFSLAPKHVPICITKGARCAQPRSWVPK